MSMMNRTQKQTHTEIYRTYLEDAGYSPKIVKDGAVIFKYENGNYLLTAEKDEMFINLIYPNFWSIDSEPERAMVMLAALEATKSVKVAKVYPLKDDVCCAIELFCASPEAFKAVLERSLEAIKMGVLAFGLKMAELNS